jgi:hypothetical protein
VSAGAVTGLGLVGALDLVGFFATALRVFFALRMGFVTTCFCARTLGARYVGGA